MKQLSVQHVIFATLLFGLGLWFSSNAYAIGEGLVILSKHNGKCLDVDDGLIKNNGANIQQWDCHGDASQRWRLSFFSANGWYIGPIPGKGP